MTTPYFLRIRTAAAALLLLAAGAAAQTGAPAKAPFPLVAPVQDKNFYLLSLLERTPGVATALAGDATLSKVLTERLAALDNAAKSCGLDSACHAAVARWSDAQTAEVGQALAALYEKSPAVKTLVDGPLRSSGTYIRFYDAGGAQALVRAWKDCAAGINRMIDVYALGGKPRYPAIDSMTYDAKADSYRNVIQSLTAILEDDRASLKLFFQPSLRFALEAMWFNHRDEAGRVEPMETTENAAAYRHARAVQWAKYPYSVIVVPGAGNEIPGVRLSPGGKQRDEIAAKRYRDGKAPFILVSGGYVHPSQTEYAEALEMKRDLMERFHIPAEAIIVDPHARHTTTNMRNAARLMYRYGVPFDRRALVSTDLSQSRYIEDPGFAKRCVDELGYVPYKLLGRTSPFDLEFMPMIESLQIDPQDPLDP